MAKVIVNGKDSKCFTCGSENIAKLNLEGDVVCLFCGSKNISTLDGQQFYAHLKADMRFPERGWKSSERRRKEDE